ncbi:hypothetical protein MTBBW1_460022 [Desulfamplus magnetovallimortis]|uniref:Restriction endonuclease type IV Mrr domain-containing protein n=2 Tax=Desulfamplus magnetovallimortis TaxID=1246637 RepID=A0A1W1HHE3_9BACT|nr:hypothetical protein MTBBW1_460022 [Desulfamplus magnetovallimortis]
MLEWGNADIDFRGLQDGTLNLILRNRFEKEIHNFEPDLKKEFHEQIKALKQEKQKIQGMLSNLTGQVAEMQLANAFRSRKRFKLSTFFTIPDGGNIQDEKRINEKTDESSFNISETSLSISETPLSIGETPLNISETPLNISETSFNISETSLNITDTPLNIVDVKTRVIFQREDGKNMELDIVAESSCGRILLVEVKKQAAKSGRSMIEDFHEKVMVYQNLRPDNIMIPAFLSLGGFTETATILCREKKIAINERIVNF